MKDFINNLNFCQLITILWVISMTLDIFRKNIMGMAACAGMAILTTMIGKWIY